MTGFLIEGTLTVAENLKIIEIFKFPSATFKRSKAFKVFMNQKEWIYVMDEASLPEGSMAPVYPRGVNVVMVRVKETVYALEGKCAHMGCPLFCGTLTGAILTCPCHDWRFNVQTGEFVDAAELRLKIYPTRVENGQLFVSLA